VGAGGVGRRGAAWRGLRGGVGTGRMRSLAHGTCMQAALQPAWVERGVRCGSKDMMPGAAPFAGRVGDDQQPCRGLDRPLFDDEVDELVWRFLRAGWERVFVASTRCVQAWERRCTARHMRGAPETTLVRGFTADAACGWIDWVANQTSRPRPELQKTSCSWRLSQRAVPHGGPLPRSKRFDRPPAHRFCSGPPASSWSPSGTAGGGDHVGLPTNG
jgi:hypothetical protein